MGKIKTQNKSEIIEKKSALKKEKSKKKHNVSFSVDNTNDKTDLIKLDFRNLIDDIGKDDFSENADDKELSHAKSKPKQKLVNKVQFKASKKIKHDSNSLLNKVIKEIF